MPIVANQIGELMAAEAPALFSYYAINHAGAWTTPHRKV